MSNEKPIEWSPCKYNYKDIIVDSHSGRYQIVGIIHHPEHGWHYTAVRLATLSVYESDIDENTKRFHVVSGALVGE